MFENENIWYYKLGKTNKQKHADISQILVFLCALMCQYLNICLRKCPSKALPEHIVLTIQQKYTIGFQGIESNFFFFFSAVCAFYDVCESFRCWYLTQLLEKCSLCGMILKQIIFLHKEKVVYSMLFQFCFSDSDSCLPLMNL